MTRVTFGKTVQTDLLLCGNSKTSRKTAQDKRKAKIIMNQNIYNRSGVFQLPQRQPLVIISQLHVQTGYAGKAVSFIHEVCEALLTHPPFHAVNKTSIQAQSEDLSARTGHLK